METNWIVTDKNSNGLMNREFLEIDDNDAHTYHACRETEHSRLRRGRRLLQFKRAVAKPKNQKQNKKKRSLNPEHKIQESVDQKGTKRRAH